jgi:cellulose synthase/poly-beta-1,6-N-acetylglucosamine synthase-like glycosyltransferase
MRALREARGSVIVLVDDDNFLHTSYLKAAWKRFSADPGIGVAGGIVRPEFDGPPPAWFKLVARSLSVNDWGKPEQEQWTPPNDPPPGTGLALRAEAFRRAAQCSLALHDRRGLVLTSGGDTEIVLRIQLLGWKVDYEPGMQMSHFLPCRRFEPAYLVGLKEGFGAASCIIDLYDAFRPTLPSIYYARRARHHWQEKRRLTRSARAAVEESLRIKDTLEAAYHRGRARGYARLAWSQRDRRLVDRFLERAGVGHGV